jgi:hypothetical protein
MERLDNSNSLLYAAKHYDNPSCMDIVEFYDDLKRFKYIKRLLNKYRDSGNLKIRLVLNHIILLYNLFGQDAATRLLFLKLDGYYSELLPFLLYLNRLPEVVYQVGLPPQDINTGHIKPDIRLFELIKETVDG